MESRKQHENEQSNSDETSTLSTNLPRSDLSKQQLKLDSTPNQHHPSTIIRKEEQTNSPTKKSPNAGGHETITIMSANANSLKNKITSLKFNISQLHPHIIVIQETKIKRKSQVKLEGYEVYPTVRGDCGGG